MRATMRAAHDVEPPVWVGVWAGDWVGVWGAVAVVVVALPELVEGVALVGLEEEAVVGPPGALLALLPGVGVDEQAATVETTAAADATASIRRVVGR
ncbi:MAG: hypothetical protein ACKOVB_20140 [Terrabacter sp.]